MPSLLTLTPSGASFAKLNAVGTRVLQPGAAAGQLRLPTDPIGNFSLTLTNVVVGSAIQVESTTGQVVLNRTAVAPTEAFAVQAYAVGSPLNNLRIKVRKGSASPYYQPWETQATAVVGSQSIYVSQIPDE